MKYFLVIFCIFSCNTLFTQENLDNVWIFGQFDFTPNPLYMGNLVDFGTGEPIAVSHSVTFEMDFANTSMCDEEGNLLFYTNGRYIGNAEHEIMENGDNLNGEYTVGSDEYLILTQGVVSVPVPDDPLNYYVFHLGIIPIYPDGVLQVGSYPLSYSKVSMQNPDYPLGEVIEKNTAITNDTMNIGKLTLTRHANGRDWWLLCGHWNVNRYSRFLISPTGIEDTGIQEVGSMTYRGRGQAVFSPDGTKYAQVALKSGGEAYLDLYDFDRCAGELSNHRQYLYTEGASALGVSISPDSRYLYFNTSTKIFQFDTHADDIWASEQLVAEYDGYEEEITNTVSGATFHVPTTFFLQQLGPDGKIYLNATNSVSSLHVIDQPNEAGAACNVIQRGLDLPALNRFSLPNFPNYRLGRLEGSPCDTLDFTSTTEMPATGAAVRVYPNPNEGYFTVESLSSGGIVFYLFNAVGQKVHEQPCAGTETLVEVGHLPAGVYFYRIAAQGKFTDSGKIFINH